MDLNVYMLEIYANNKLFSYYYYIFLIFPIFFEFLMTSLVTHFLWLNVFNIKWMTTRAYQHKKLMQLCWYLKTSYLYLIRWLIYNTILNVLYLNIQISQDAFVTINIKIWHMSTWSDICNLKWAYAISNLDSMRSAIYNIHIFRQMLYQT